MSFMPVAGKIFVCAECKKRVKVHYVGGSLEAQIGDMAVRRQLEYSEHLGQPSTNPYEDGLYLYDIGVCGGCYAKVESPEDRELYGRIFQLVRAIESRKAEAELECAIESDGAFGLIPRDYMEKGFDKSPIKWIVKRYRENNAPLMSQLSALLDLSKGKGYLQKHTHTHVVESLLDYLNSDEKVCYPRGAIDEVFYCPVQYDVPVLMQSLAINPDKSQSPVKLLLDMSCKKNLAMPSGLR